MNDTQLVKSEPMSLAPAKLTSLDILESAVRGGITSENVSVVKELIAMRREEASLEAKSKFNRAFFELREDISHMDFYADKTAKTDSGAAVYSYCSERELQSKLDPVLFRHGFAMLFGQRDEGEKTVAIITLIHKDGHQEDREYAVRSGGTNRMKDATAADTGATTSAWRHLVIKMFGIKSRISETDDARNLGSYITKKQADDLEMRIKLTNSNLMGYKELAGILPTEGFEKCTTSKYEVLDQLLSRKERAGK